MTRRILAIDDEESSLLIIKTSLEMTTDWHVITAVSPLKGLDVAAAEQPDAIVLDVIMQELDGVSTFHRLQENPLTKHIPVIFLTVKAHRREQKTLAQLESAGVLTKPFEPELLAAQIRRFLGWS